MRPKRSVGCRVDVVFNAGCAEGEMYGVSWTRYDGRALADITLQGGLVGGRKVT
jgi:hypothetical protein